ncbi:Fe-S cluster assembly protein SufD, partial [Pseudomonas aeruginosa]|nr:Fe-S cluster assembly protein SufD [Pseudomonas aeruginosa]
MTKEKLVAFSQAHAEPAWLQERRLAALEAIPELELPTIERVKFHRWNLGDGTLTENESLASVPDFIAIGDNPKLVQVGTQTVLEQLPMALIDKGVVFSDFYTALEEIPEVIEAHFGQALAFDEDKLAAYHTAYFNSAAVLYVPDHLEITTPIEAIFLQDSDSDVPFNKHVL